MFGFGSVLSLSLLYVFFMVKYETLLVNNVQFLNTLLVLQFATHLLPTQSVSVANCSLFCSNTCIWIVNTQLIVYYTSTCLPSVAFSVNEVCEYFFEATIKLTLADLGVLLVSFGHKPLKK